MAKTSKATRKFQNKHLKHTIDHRREVQKENKKYASRRGSKKSGEPAEAKEKISTKPIFDDMSVDAFFEGGFEVPNAKKGGKRKGSGDGSEDEPEDESEDESEDMHQEGLEEESGGSEQSEAVSEDGLASENESDDQSSSEEEDEEQMKQDMKALAEKDPEFYKYLQKNDKNLLDFETSNPLDAISGSDESEAEGSTASKKQMNITSSIVDKWDRSLKKTPTLKTIKQVIDAFKAAVEINSSDENDTPYKVNDETVFTSLMFVGLKRVPEAIQTLLAYQKNKKEQRVVDTNKPIAAKIASLMRHQASAYLTILHDINNTETAALVLSSVLEVLPYYVSLRKILKKIVQAVADVWATTKSTETQVAAYAFLNNAAREFPKTALEVILRVSYSLFLKHCSTTNVYTSDSINFAKNSAAELFGIDEQLSYTVGFDFVRQLAVHLRNTITSTSSANGGKDAHKIIYNWQFCHSLDFWSRVLFQHCNPEKELITHKSHESPLRSLIYPLVQVTLGVIRLIPTPQFFPLRFYLIRSLIRLSQGTGVFIPIFPLLSEILTSTAFTKAPKNNPLPALEFEYIIKVGAQYLGTRVYQEGLQSQFIELTSEYLVLYCKSIAFPELVTPVVLTLRRFAKNSKNGKFNKQILQLVEKLNANASYITSKRRNVDYGPSNKAEVQAFLKDEKWEDTPLGQYVSVHRKVRDAQAKLLKQAIADEQEAKARKGSAEFMDDAMDTNDSDQE